VPGLAQGQGVTDVLEEIAQAIMDASSLIDEYVKYGFFCECMELFSPLHYINVLAEWMIH
jgi:hypothetical protein